MTAHPDPIFAAIAEWRVAYDEYEEGTPKEERYGKAVDLMIETHPTTVAGAHAKLAAIEEMHGDHTYWETKEWASVVRGMLAAV